MNEDGKSSCTGEARKPKYRDSYPQIRTMEEIHQNETNIREELPWGILFGFSSISVENRYPKEYKVTDAGRFSGKGFSNSFCTFKRVEKNKLPNTVLKKML